MKKTILTLVVTSLLAITSARAAITSVLLSFNDNVGTPDAITSSAVSASEPSIAVESVW